MMRTAASSQNKVLRVIPLSFKLFKQGIFCVEILGGRIRDMPEHNTEWRLMISFVIQQSFKWVSEKSLKPKFHPLFLTVNHFYYIKWGQKRVTSIKSIDNIIKCYKNSINTITTVPQYKQHEAARWPTSLCMVNALDSKTLQLVN